jgi:hypothetical protein
MGNNARAALITRAASRRSALGVASARIPTFPRHGGRRRPGAHCAAATCRETASSGFRSPRASIPRVSEGTARGRGGLLDIGGGVRAVAQARVEMPITEQVCITSCTRPVAARSGAHAGGARQQVDELVGIRG